MTFVESLVLFAIAFLASFAVGVIPLIISYLMARNGPDTPEDLGD